MDTVTSYLKRFSYKPQGRVFTFLSASAIFGALGLIAPNWEIPRAKGVAIGFFCLGGLSAIIADRCIGEDREEMAIAEIYKESRAGYAVDVLTTEEQIEVEAVHRQVYNPEAKTELQPEIERQEPEIFYYN